MKLNPKVILIGGLVFYAVMFAVSMLLGGVIHEGVLDPLYKANQEFWRPELNEVPPDVGALMPRWITVGLLMAFLWTAIWDNIRSAFDGSNVIKGLKFGIVMALIYGSIGAAWSGVFNLPDAIWAWWAAEGFVNYAIGGAALGWVTGKLSSD